MGSKTHTTMKKIITLALLAVATLTSCELDKEDVPITPDPTESTEPSIPVENFDDIYALGWTQQEGQTARLTLDFNVTDTTTTRSTGTAMERSVDDVNLYFFNDIMEIEQHIFLGENTSVTLPITPGEWAIYAVANIGYNMGDKSHDELKGYSYDIVLESDLTYKESLIMSYCGGAEISDIETLNILFTRVLSRVDMKISLTGDAASNVMLDRLRMVNMPKRSYLFDDSGAAPDVSDLMTYDYRDCGDGSTISFYMLENLSGNNYSITSEEQKTSANAPSTAAYIEIEAETTTSWVTYRVYLGENSTDDFNVKRNNIYDMEISIYSADATDFRTSVKYFPMDVRVWISSCDIQMNQKKTTSSIAWVDSIDIDITVSIDQYLLFDIDVEYRPMTTISQSGDMSHIDCTFTNEPIVTIKAGSLKGSMQTNYVFDVWYYALMTHARLFDVVKSSDEDNNTYIVSEDYFEPTVTYVLTVI